MSSPGWFLTYELQGRDFFLLFNQFYLGGMINGLELATYSALSEYSPLTSNLKQLSQNAKALSYLFCVRNFTRNKTREND